MQAVTHVLLLARSDSVAQRARLLLIPEDFPVEFHHVTALRDLPGALADAPCDVVLVEHAPPAVDAFETVARVDKIDGHPPVVAALAPVDRNKIAALVKAGIDGVVDRETLDGLGVSVVGAIERARANRDDRRKQDASGRTYELNRRIAELAPDGIAVVYGETIVHANAALAQILCAGSPSRLTGRAIDEFVHPEDREDLARCRQHVLEDRRPAGKRRMKFLQCDGTDIRVETLVGACPWEDGVASLFIVRDVTEPEQEKQRYQSLVDLSPDGIAVVVDDKIVFANRAFSKMLGYDDPETLLGADPVEFHLPEERHLILARRKALLAEQRDLRPLLISLRRSDGSMVGCESRPEFISWQGNPAVLIAYRDISGRKQAQAEKEALQDQLRQAQRMESLGTLAGGIAHEFNNLLQPIIGLTELTLYGLDDGSTERENLEIVLQNCRRAAQMIEKILSFGHRDERRLKPVDLGAVATGVRDLLGLTLPATIAIACDLDEGVHKVLADETEFYQVLINLAANSVHAIDGAVGTITFKVRNELLHGPLVGRVSKIAPGKYVVLTVSDTGGGIDEETIDRIFEPFFTTKEVGKGTGLGLSMIHGVVTGHNGGIDVVSAPGRGTTFSLFVPALDQGEAACFHDAGTEDTAEDIELGATAAMGYR